MNYKTKGPKSVVICAYNNFKKLKAKYLNRTVEANIHVESGQFYYFSTRGKVRQVYEDGNIYMRL